MRGGIENKVVFIVHVRDNHKTVKSRDAIGQLRPHQILHKKKNLSPILMLSFSKNDMHGDKKRLDEYDFTFFLYHCFFFLSLIFLRQKSNLTTFIIASQRKTPFNYCIVCSFFNNALLYLKILTIFTAVRFFFVL